MSSTLNNLIEAEKKAANLFLKIESQGLLEPGKSEKEIKHDELISDFIDFDKVIEKYL